jgi:hypothetical protein
MNKGSLWVLRTFSFLAIIFSGLEKAFSYLTLGYGHALEANPVPRFTILAAGLLGAHILGFIFSLVLIFFMYKITIEFDCRLTTMVGVVVLAIALSMFFGASICNLRSLQMLETSP